jgi:uncharacterized protein YuzE
VVVGKHDKRLVVIPIERSGNSIMPVTIHTTTRANRSDFVCVVGDSSMKKPRMAYFEESDVLHLMIADEKESGSVELAPNVTAELNKRGELIGVEILEASRFVRDFVLEAAQVKMLNWPAPSLEKD